MRVAQQLAGLLARRGRQPPQGHRQEDPRADREGAHEVRRRAASRSGHTDEFARADVRHRSSRSPTTRSTSRTRVGYGFVTYQTAYLKANHPVEYLAALLTSVKTQPGQGRGLPQRVPPARASRCSSPTSTSRPATSRASSRAERRAGRDPLRAVGGAQRRRGRRRADHRRARADGPFADFYDFCDRVDPSVLNKRTIESLIKAGAFDSLGHPRQGLLARVRADRRRACSAVARKRGRGHSSSLFDRGRRRRRRGRCSTTALAIPDTEFAKSQRLAFEKEMLGLYVSDHPLMGAERALRRHVECTLAELARARRGRDAHRRRRRHRAAAASTRSAATSWPRSCSRTSRPRSR